MKTTAIILLLSIPIASSAQNYQGMSEEDMQKMMKQIQEMESCMGKLDQAQVKKLEQRSKQINAEVKSLCASGKRDKAQSKAISFGKEIEKDLTILAIRKCSEKIKGLMPNMSQPKTPLMDQPRASSKQHVCD